MMWEIPTGDHSLYFQSSPTYRDREMLPHVFCFCAKCSTEALSLQAEGFQVKVSNSTGLFTFESLPYPSPSPARPSQLETHQLEAGNCGERRQNSSWISSWLLFILGILTLGNITPSSLWQSLGRATNQEVARGEMENPEFWWALLSP